jgi:hypothetical protein
MPHPSPRASGWASLKALSRHLGWGHPPLARLASKCPRARRA